LAQHSLSKSRRGTSTIELDTEITVIIPFNEYGDLDDLEFSNSSAFTREARVIHAPELDDLHESDNLYPVRLAVPLEFQADAGAERRTSRAYRDSHTDTSDGNASTDVIHLGSRAGAHRKGDSGVIKGRLVAAAMAAGATAAATYSVINGPETAHASTLLAGGQSTNDGGFVSGSVDGIQIVSVAPAASTAVHNEELANGAAFAQERAEREARLTQPLYVMPTRGAFTSGFGYRWGVLHGGIDLANSIGTPIYAVSDGVVIDAGPTAGYGAWVKLLHADGTVTLYGHVNTWLVSVGQRVMAGDQIATIGNRGNSTGPHCHFEVLLNGTDRIDPLPWLAKRGLSPGKYTG
jgi:Peptidase family M23